MYYPKCDWPPPPPQPVSGCGCGSLGDDQTDANKQLSRIMVGGLLVIVVGVVAFKAAGKL